MSGIHTQPCSCPRCENTKLRADLARVTAELAAVELDASELRESLTQSQFRAGQNWEQAESYRRERDAARAQVRELLKVARAAVRYNQTPNHSQEESDAHDELIDAVDALPPSALEETADLDAERRSRAMGHLLTTWEPVVRAAVAFRKAPAYSEDASSACQTLEDAIDALPATSIPK